MCIIFSKKKKGKKSTDIGRLIELNILIYHIKVIT
jgi:hypothetical protein